MDLALSRLAVCAPSALAGGRRRNGGSLAAIAARSGVERHAPVAEPADNDDLSAYSAGAACGAGAWRRIFPAIQRQTT